MKKRAMWALILMLLLPLAAGAIPCAQAAAEKKLCDAGLLSGGRIGVLYLSGSSVCYGVLSPADGGWSGGAVASGKDAALAIGPDGHPHIAYITPEDNLGYTKWDGSGWTTPVVLDSISFNNIDGPLSCPDIAVDAGGFAHIAYMDARGGRVNPNTFTGHDKEDLVYATNASGSFVKSVRSYSHGWLATDFWKNLVIPPPKIVWAGVDYRIGVKQNENTYVAINDKYTYTNTFNLFGAEASNRYLINSNIQSNNDLGFVLYDMEAYGTVAYSLFKMSGNLYVTNGTEELGSATKSFSAAGADLFVSGNGEVYYAGVKTNALLLYQDGAFKESLTLPAAIGSHTRVATVVTGGMQYTLYSDASYNLWVAKVPVGGNTVTSDKLVDKTTVTISGITVSGKTYDGLPAAAAGTPVAVVGSTPVTVSGYDYVWYDADSGGVLPSAPSAAGRYQLVVSVKSGDASYTGRLELPFTISKKEVSVTGLDATDQAYNASDAVTLTGGALSGAVDGDAVWAVLPAVGTMADANAGEDKPVTVDTVSLSGDDAGNYTLTQPTGVTVNIGKASLTVAGATVGGKTYDGGISAAVTEVSFGGLQGGESLTPGTDYAVSAAYASADAGANIPVTGVVTLLDTAVSRNYSLADGSFHTTGEIAKAGGLEAVSPPVFATGRNRSYRYNLNGITLNRPDTGPLCYTLGVPSGDELFSAAPALDEDGETLLFTTNSAKTGSATLAVTISSGNYEDVAVSLAFAMTEKTPVTITGVDVADKTYDGVPAQIAGTPVAAAGDATVEVTGCDYAWYDAERGVGLPAAPVNAGRYRLVVSVEADDPDYIGSFDVPFEIFKRPLTARPADRVITVGEDLPAPELTYEGLVPGENGSDAVSFDEPPVMEIRNRGGGVLTDSAAAGDYPIVLTNASAAVSRNYSLTVEAGTLRILAAAPVDEPDNGSQASPVITASEETAGGTAVTLQSNAHTGPDGYAASVTRGDMDALLAEAGRRNAVTRSDTLEVAVIAPEGLAGLSVRLPHSSWAEMAERTEAKLRISTPVLSVTFDHHAMDAVSQAGAGGSVEIAAKLADPSSLSGELLELAAGRPVYDITVLSGDRPVSEFGAGAVTVAVPYALRPGERPEAVVMLRLNGDGSLETLRGRYDEALGMAVFETSHFSRFLVLHNPVTYADVPQSAWFRKAVDFIASRGITDGIAGESFGPDAALSRGQFIVMLTRAFGIPADDRGSGNFEDAGDNYYTGYLAAAKRLGIAQGVGGNRFNPEKTITRQELFVLLYRTLALLDELPEEGDAGTVQAFSDAAEVQDFALEAMETFVKSGIVNGVDNRLAPGETCTRAQMAQVLYRLLFG